VGHLNYEKAGLIDRVWCNTGNQRRYAASDVAWLEFLLRLRETGMPIADMQRFAQLQAAGDATLADRLAILREHRRGLDERIRALQQNAHALDEKIDTYVGMLSQQQEKDHA
jgi:DNA-binding transcriptional MerR regulator